MAVSRRVILGGIATPVLLEECGPKINEADVVTFERKLGFALPSAYREFLLTYNGGSPVLGVVDGRDDEPGVSYRYGDAVRYFLQLQPAGVAVASYERLQPVSEHPWGLPHEALEIASDEGGNGFVLMLASGEVRFVDHEALKRPIHEHRVLADSFLDFLLRFRDEP